MVCLINYRCWYICRLNWLNNVFLSTYFLGPQGNSWDKIEKEEGSFAYFSREESKNLDLGYGLLKSQGNNKNNKIDVKNDAKVAIHSKMTKKSPSKAESESKAMASNDSIDETSNMGSGMCYYDFGLINCTLLVKHAPI